MQQVIAGIETSDLGQPTLWSSRYGPACAQPLSVIVQKVSNMNRTVAALKISVQWLRADR